MKRRFGRRNRRMLAIGFSESAGGGGESGPSADALQLESGDYLLLESGDYLLLE